MEELENLQEGDPEDYEPSEPHVTHIKKKNPSGVSRAFREPTSSREPMSDEEARMRHGAAMADALAAIQRQFGMGAVQMKVSGSEAEKIVNAIKAADADAPVEIKEK